IRDDLVTGVQTCALPISADIAGLLAKQGVPPDEAQRRAEAAHGSMGQALRLTADKLARARSPATSSPWPCSPRPKRWSSRAPRPDRKSVVQGKEGGRGHP